ncbi:unnamed protein product [Clonostachys rhizophaga]|uniref:Uncharacterized protein n=1 Tax=Clonostachys rhizophaga TaxID=160324 RepID=A0A9N9UYI8_9HYPO|nr:unnamed protein product [Clonostachys rhizophaga]
MATNPFDPTISGLPFFDIYSDPIGTARTNGLALPGGACNFVDLSPGANGAKCGCRRFWIRSTGGTPNLDSTSWCMCNHHACFHDEGSHDVPPVEFRVPEPGQENERPRTGREPLSPMIDQSQKMLLPASGLGLPSFGIDDKLSFIYNDPDFKVAEVATEKPIPSSIPPATGSLPDTLGWGEPMGNKPPASPSQFLIPSQASSTTSSIRARYLKPFAGKGLNTLGSAQETKCPPPLPPTADPHPPTHSNSAPIVEDSFVLVPAIKDRAGASQETTQHEPRASVFGETTRQEFKNLSDAVVANEQRLERLENVSFSAGNDECHERHDQMDLRVTDLESRMEEAEKQAAEYAAAASRQADKTDDSATQSVASFSTEATNRPSHSQELYSQLQTLQARVDSLQSALPSPNHAWEIEVVYLPFPLKKVWQDESAARGAERSQLPMTYSSENVTSMSPLYQDWANSMHEAQWLFPKACGDKSVTDKRLRSRGLIKKLSVHGPDARSVDAAMHQAFSSVWQEMHIRTQANSANPRTSKFLGLHSSWVPLRKLHKDSCLRFLSPAEMLTPAIWTVQFLTTVMMRSSEPRLFVTHPDAYLQDLNSYETGWTWQRVRELSRVYSESDSQGVPEADAMEEYWAWNERLDDPPNAPVSLSMRHLKHTPHTSSSSSISQYHPAVSHLRSPSPAVIASGVPAYISRSRHSSRPLHVRTTSLPVVESEQELPAAGRRRVMSGGGSRRGSPSVKGVSQHAILKRRRTRSPNHLFTPRWTASPSPMPAGPSARGHTPFTYATPHSNAPLQDAQILSGGIASPSMGARGFDEIDAFDELYEIEIYESPSDEDFEDDESTGTVQVTARVESHTGPEAQNRQLPEDEPWPGIEDQDQLSDEENVDPRDIDMCSDCSSQPSEYPSTHNAWPNNGDEFQIHEDND